MYRLRLGKRLWSHRGYWLQDDLGFGTDYETFEMEQAAKAAIPRVAAVSKVSPDRIKVEPKHGDLVPEESHHDD